MVTIIIMGGTGDLAKTKIYPALLSMFRKGKLSKFDIIGTSRHEKSQDAYREEVGENVDPDGWKEFQKHIHFSQLNFYEEKQYKDLKKRVEEYDDHRIFYLSTLPQHFEAITKGLHSHGLANEKSKILYEKPFGDDLKSAKKLNKCIHKTFSEDKIYRIDHYLNKELIGNISVLRFTNVMMEPVWRSEYVDHIQIIMSESFGVKKRGDFYDKYGAIKDVFQNHLLQLLALIAMEEPKRFDSKNIRDEKVKLIKKVKVEDVITGQYKGYTKEKGVSPGSDKETFFAMKIGIGNKRWKGVPIYMTSGKKLEDDVVKIIVQFKNTACDLFEGICPLTPNQVTICLKPEKKIYFTLNIKKPGELGMVPSRIEFSYSQKFGPNTPEAYENVFSEAIQSKQTSFVRSDEIEAEWGVVDKIKMPQIFTYEKGKFPQKARDFIKEYGTEWYEL